MIEYLSLRIEPVTYADGVKELRVMIVVNGQEYHHREILRNDDFKSFFEQIWERAGCEISTHIKSQDKVKE